MADYYTQFSMMFDPGEANRQTAIELHHEMWEAGEAGDGDDPPRILFEARLDDSGLWLHDDGGGSGDIESVIAFVLACAERFNLKGRWGFTYALTCSKPRLDAFGGGYVMIDFDTGAVDQTDASFALDRALKNDG